MDRPTLAWSSPFVSEAIPTVEYVGPVDTITWEEAMGDSRGEGVKVAVIDSGIDATHPALNGPIQGYAAFQKTAEGIIATSDPHADESGHATACAGIIRSIAPACELYSVKVLGRGSIGLGTIFIEGLRWAITNGMHVCNLSLGTTRKDFFATLHEVTDLAYFQRVILVTAANNMPIPSFPSLYASVISVAAHEEQDPYRFYYNPHPPVEFGAPGIDVRVPWTNGQWITATGNSFAAPHLTGIVAKLLGKHPGLTPFQVKTILCALSANTAHPRSVPSKQEANKEIPSHHI